MYCLKFDLSGTRIFSVSYINIYFILFYSILFYSILFYSILYYSILSYIIMKYYSILYLQSILFYFNVLQKGSDDFLVKVWSVQTGRLLASLRGHEVFISFHFFLIFFLPLFLI